jgi:hypothetical protein
LIFTNHHYRDNTCPQCRESFSSRRNCKPDPTFDQLLKAIFGADTSTADDAFLNPPSEALAAAKTIGTDLELLREAQRLLVMKAKNGPTAQQHEYRREMDSTTLTRKHMDAPPPPPTAAVGSGRGNDLRNGNNGQQQQQHQQQNQDYDNNEGLYTRKPQLIDKVNYKRPASAPAHDLANNDVSNADGMKKKIKKNTTLPIVSAAGMGTKGREDTDQGYQHQTTYGDASMNKDLNRNPARSTQVGATPHTNPAATTTTAAAAAALPHFRSPSKGPGRPSTKYFGVRKYHPLGPGTQPWYLAYSQEGGTTSSTVHYIKLGQYSSEEEAARIHDIHTLRSKGIHPKKLSSAGSNLNFPYLSTIYVRLLAHGIAPGATPSEYEAASSKISTAVHGVGAPPGWHPPLEKIENRAGGSRGGGSGAGAGSDKRGADVHTNKKLKFSSAAAASTLLHHQSGYVANGNQPYNNKKVNSKHGNTQILGGDDAAAATFENKVDAAVLRAEELATKFSLSNMLGPSSGRPTAVVIELKPSDGLSLSKTWKMDWMMCPQDTIISEIAAIIAEGINNKGETASKNKISGDNGVMGGGNGDVILKTEEVDITMSGPVSASSVYLNTVNELDASADFMSVYKEIEGSGGLLALTPTMQIRDLILLLADCGEDLVLEYVIQ